MDYFEFTNPHPKGLRVGDCVKRAITLATGKDYMEVQKELNRCKKITGCSKFNENRNYKYYLEKVLHCDKQFYKAVKDEPRMNGRLFAMTHPTGKYILRMARHLSCCVNGKIRDTWDCSAKCVYNSWKVEE